MSKATLQCNALYLVPTRHKAPSSDDELNYFAGAALAGQPDRSGTQFIHTAGTSILHVMDWGWERESSRTSQRRDPDH